MGEQHGVAEQLLGAHGVLVAGVGVVPGADQQDRGVGLGVPRPGVAVVAAGRPVRGARGPQPPALDRSRHRALGGEVADHRRPVRDGLGGRPVQARDRRGLRHLGPGPGCAPQGGRCGQGRGVAFDGGVQLLGVVGPRARVAQRREGRQQQVAVGELTGRGRARCRDRPLARPVQQALHPSGRGLAVAGQRAPLRSGLLAQLQELGEHLVGGRRVAGDPGLGAGGVRDGVDDPVEQHRPHPLGEQVGVHLADDGAVGEADVGDGLLAGELTEAVQVAHRVRGGDVREEGAHHLTAATGQVGGQPRVALGLGRSRGDRHPLPELRRLGLAGEAVHRGAGMGAARVPADDVEPAVTPRVELVAALAHQAHPGVARAARVDEDGPDPLLGPAGGVADHRQLDLGARGVGPVQRHGHAGALEPFTAARPVDSRGGAPGCRGRPGARRRHPVRPGAARARGQRQRRQGGDRRPPPAASVRWLDDAAGAPHTLEGVHRR